MKVLKFGVFARLIAGTILLVLGGPSCNFHSQKPLPADPSDPALTSQLDHPKNGVVQKISYAQVRDLVFSKCVSCHGNSGRINLQTYATVSQSITLVQQAALIDQRMPPQRLLSAAQMKLLALWIEQGHLENPVNETASVMQPTVFPTAKVTPTPKPTSRVSYSAVRFTIFESKCLQCHGEGGFAAAAVPLYDYKVLLASPRMLVVPQKPEDSILYVAVTRKDGLIMPPDGFPRLSEEEIMFIKLWIAEGAEK